MLHIEQLERQAGTFRLDVESLTVEQGAYLVLVGPSGAGKTMLLQTIAGLHPMVRGRIWIGGVEVTHMAPERRGVGFVYQDSWLFPHLSVRANIDFGRRYQRRRGGRGVAMSTDELAEMLHIAPLLERQPRLLSGGETQRVALARALAIRPKLLLLDEPLGTLDPVTREHVAAELTRCHETFDMTTLHVTHDHAEARMLGDAAAVMLDGRLEQSGPTETVFGRPRTVALARFLGCANLHAGMAHAGAAPEVVSVRAAGHVLSVRGGRPGPVTLCVAAEHVSMRPLEDHHRADWPTGTITQVAERVAGVRIVVRVGEHEWVALLGRAEQRRIRLAVGQRVRVQVDPDTCHLIPGEGSA